MFSIEKDSEGYSLWLDFGQVADEEAGNASKRLQSLADGEGSLYIGQDCICAITKENVKNSMIRLYDGKSFDDIYDNLERICSKNPCGLKYKE